jgi:protease-4
MAFAKPLRGVSPLLLALAATAPAVASDLFVETPGASTSLAAGLVNPAAWAIQSSGGLLFAVNQDDGVDRFKDLDWSVIGSAQSLALAYESYHGLGGEERYSNWTLGLGGGDRNGSVGLSYAWKGRAAEADRWSAGAVQRRRQWSAGIAADCDRDFGDVQYRADVGLRPLGPRWTLFAATRYSADAPPDADDWNFDVGTQLFLVPGLSLAGKYSSEGRVSVGLSYSLSSTARSSANSHWAEDANGDYGYGGITYVSELGPRHSVLPISPEHKRSPEIELEGELPYRRYAFFDRGRTFLGLLEEIDRYAADPKTEVLLLNLSGFSADPARLLELRDQLAGLRARGKRVLIYADRLNMFGYMLASVADQLWLDPQGSIDVHGISWGTGYMAGTLEKLGLGFQEFRYFKYKSAAEALSRTTMSEGQREQLTALLEDWYDTIAAHVTTARGIERTAWDRTVDDDAILLSAEARELGLIDQLGDWNEMKDAADEASRRTTPDLSAAPVTLVASDPRWGDEVWGELPRIAVLYAEGPCAMDSGIKGRLLSRKIREAREDSRVKAVVLRADSPGGDPLPSDLVARELHKTMEKKPVIVSQGFVAGSGGYWISMYSDKIVATPVTITGSIGVIGGHLYDRGAGAKLGMTYQGVQVGAHADLNSGIALPLLGTLPHRPYNSSELARTETLIKDLYADFVRQVAVGRDMSEEAVREVAQGRIWSGIDGQSVGLVDELGGLWTALEMAKKAAGINSGEPIAITQGPELGGVNLESLTPKLIGLDAATVRVASEPWRAYFKSREESYLDLLRVSDSAPLAMMPPFQIRDGGSDY